MRALTRFRTPPAGMMRWAFTLATRMLAGSLNMPEPLLRGAGVLVCAHVQTAENSVAKTLCPVRLLRLLRSRRPPAR